MENIYYWVGGSSAGTTAGRFSWNVPANWRIISLTNPGVDEVTVSIPTDVPNYRDTAIVGNYVPTNFKNKKINIPTPTSPLLFGGYSGGVASGGWSAGSWGVTSGVTFTTSLRSFIISGNYSSKENDYNSEGYTFNYPFTHVGIGSTAEIFSHLRYNAGICGMTELDWSDLSSSLTAKDLGLNIKAENIIIDADTTNAKRAFMPWSVISPPREWPYPTTNTTSPRYANLRVIDNHGLFSSYLPGTKTKMTLTPVGFKVNLTDSKLYSILHDQPILDNPDATDKLSWQQDTRNLDQNTLSLINSTVMFINFNSYCNLRSSNCIIGNFIYDQDLGSKKFIWLRKEYSQWYSPGMQLGGTVDSLVAARALNITSNMNGLTSNNISVKAGSRCIPNPAAYYAPYDKTYLGYYYNDYKAITSIAPLISFGHEIPFNNNWNNVGQGYTFTSTNIYIEKADCFFQSPGTIRKLEINGGRFNLGDREYWDRSISTIKLSNNSVLRFETDWNVNVGELNNNGVLGGILSDDSDVTYNSSGIPVGGCRLFSELGGQRLINYSVDGNLNTRTQQQFTTLNQLVSIDFIDDRKT